MYMNDRLHQRARSKCMSTCKIMMFACTCEMYGGTAHYMQDKIIMHENCINGQDDIMHVCDIIKLTFKFTYFALFLISILEI